MVEAAPSSQGHGDLAGTPIASPQPEPSQAGSPAPQQQPVTAEHSPVAGAPAQDGVTLRLARPSPVALWGVLLLLVSAFLPWISNPARLSTAMDIPVAFLVDLGAAAGGFALGWVVLAAGGVGLLLCFIPRLAPLRRLLGLALFGAAVTVVVQWARYLDRLDAAGQLVAYVGIGVYLAGAAGLMLWSAPSTKGA